MNLQYPIKQNSDSTKEVNLLLSIYCHNKQIKGSYNVLGLFLFLHSKFSCWILKLNCWEITNKPVVAKSAIQPVTTQFSTLFLKTFHEPDEMTYINRVGRWTSPLTFNVIFFSVMSTSRLFPSLLEGQVSHCLLLISLFLSPVIDGLSFTTNFKSESDERFIYSSVPTASVASNASKKCLQHTEEYLTALRNRLPWAVKSKLW